MAGSHAVYAGASRRRKANADRGDHPARARIGSSGSCPWVSTCCRNRWEVAAQRSASFILFGGCAGGGGSYARRGELRDASVARPGDRGGCAEQNGDGKASSDDLSLEDCANARELGRYRKKASSVVWNCALFTERRKKRPWLDAFSEPHLRQWNGDPKSERDARGSIAHGRGRAKTPLRKPGDSPKRECAS